jgi:hypothetical protein
MLKKRILGDIGLLNTSIIAILLKEELGITTRVTVSSMAKVKSFDLMNPVSLGDTMMVMSE